MQGGQVRDVVLLNVGEIDQIMAAQILFRQKQKIPATWRIFATRGEFFVGPSAECYCNTIAVNG
jgi:hypothetical protein